MKYFIKYIFSILVVVFVFVKCTEPYQLETTTFENVLVVESSITDELDFQKVKLSRAIRLEGEGVAPESNAQVRVTDNSQNEYIFTEADPGTYISNDLFKAEPNVEYRLFIKTTNGTQYESRAEYLSVEAEINNLYAEEEILNGESGVQVYVDSNEDVGEANYFRYEYEETFKVVTPYNITLDVDLAVFDPLDFDINVQDTEEEKQVCYSTRLQTEIIQANVTNSTGNNINKLPIRFVSGSDYLLSERYSILVKQYVQSFDSYNYYKTLKELGSFESLLVENQTGFVQGNISSKNDIDEKVIGFFEVSSVASKRIYFSFSDYSFAKPNYPYVCEIDTLDYRDATSIDGDRNDRLWLYTRFEKETPPWELLDIEYLDGGTDPWGNPVFIPIYFLLTPQCGNCTTFSSNIKPEFWED